MSQPLLGQLERVHLREAWEREDIHFTPWLAKAENLKLLGEAIDLELELEGQEAKVGPFRADIICRDVLSNQRVLIENQIERTDHSHLGQVITYAAGLQAHTIVWIAHHFAEEHRAALDWLNQVTDANLNFFGVEIELWRIGESPMAPKFNIVAKPNDWSKTIAETAKQIQNQDLSEIKQLQWEFWSDLQNFMNTHTSAVKPQKPLPNAWANFTIGRSGFLLRSSLNSRDQEIRVELLIESPQASTYFSMLEAQREAIEQELGEPAIWRADRGLQSSAISLSKAGMDLKDKDQWSQMVEWFYTKLNLMHQVFKSRVQGLQVEGFS